MQIFDINTTATYRVKHTYHLSLHSNGVFRISKTAANLINLCQGDRIAIIENNGEWYLSKLDTGFEVKQDTKGCLLFYSRHVARLILDFFEMTLNGSYKFVIAKEPKIINENQSLLLISKSIEKK